MTEFKQEPLIKLEETLYPFNFTLKLFRTILVTLYLPLNQILNYHASFPFLNGTQK
jgi:hypothetical protein